MQAAAQPARKTNTGAIGALLAAKDQLLTYGKRSAPAGMIASSTGEMRPGEKKGAGSHF
jgi:hypothetical protein